MCFLEGFQWSYVANFLPVPLHQAALSYTHLASMLYDVNMTMPIHSFPCTTVQGNKLVGLRFSKIALSFPPFFVVGVTECGSVVVVGPTWPD